MIGPVVEDLSEIRMRFMTGPPAVYEFVTTGGT
jgi:hypothetical protein